MFRDLRSAYVRNNLLWFIVTLRQPPPTRGLQRGIRPPSKALRHENRFPLSVTHESQTSYISMQTWDTHIHNCIPVENPRVSFWPWSTLDTGTEAPAYINGAFLLSRGKPHTHSMTRIRSQGNPLTYSHAPAFCKCQTVRERVYLGAVWYFYTFVTASLSLSQTHAHARKLGLPTLPIQWRATLALVPNTR